MLLILVGFTFYIVKRMDGSVEIKPYIFRLPWRLICHEDCGYLSQFEDVSRHVHGEFTWIWTDLLWGDTLGMLF